MAENAAATTAAMSADFMRDPPLPSGPTFGAAVSSLDFRRPRQRIERLRRILRASKPWPSIAFWQLGAYKEASPEFCYSRPRLLRASDGRRAFSRSKPQ